MRKYLLLISLLLLIIITFSETYDVRGVEELSYVLAIGIDKSDSPEEPLALTIQIVKPDTSQGGGTKKTTEIKTVNCNSFSLGIAMLNLENAYELNLSHCSAIVISEELAKDGIENFVGTVGNNTEIRPTCNVLICQESAKDFLEAASKIEDVSAKFYNSFINSAKTTSYVTPCRLSEFYAATTNDVKQPVAVYSFIKDDTLESLGLAAFKECKMVGRLSGLDTLCYNILTNNFDRATIEIYNSQNDGIPITVDISRSDNTKIQVKLEDGKPTATCQINIEAKLISAGKNFDLTSPQSQVEIESEINKFLEDNISNFLYRTSEEYKSDIIGFQGYFKRNFLTQDELDKYNWEKLYPETKFQIQTTTYLDLGSLFSKN